MPRAGREREEAVPDAWRRSGIWGAGMQTSGQENYSNYVFQNGATYLNEDLTECIVDSPEGTEAFAYLAGFFVDGLTPDIAIQQANPVAEAVMLIQRGFWYPTCEPACAVDPQTGAPLPEFVSDLFPRGFVMLAVGLAVLALGQFVFSRLEKTVPERL